MGAYDFLQEDLANAQVMLTKKSTISLEKFQLNSLFLGIALVENIIKAPKIDEK